ncbi:MAG TPA: ATP-binding protein [Candidatus Binataceae bacterium]|nr:ATP-binding protein [Candidatus Binataceae bacterium]
MATNLWREIIEGLPDALIVLSLDFIPLASNPAAETLLEGTIAETTVRSVLASNPWLREMLQASLQRAQIMDNPDAVLTLERRKIAVHAQVSPMLGKRHAPTKGVILLLHDLSSQRTMERTLDPDLQVVRLSPAGLAHEVKNPLTGIKGAAELLKVMYPGDARAEQYCGLILHGVNRITSLVEQAMAASRPARLRSDKLNIHQVLHQALKTAGLFETAPDGIRIEQLFDPSLPEINGDAEALERVFVNLLRNAVEAIPANGNESGHIRIKTAIETQLRVSSEGRRRQFLRVEVSDNGSGMTQEEMAQLFAPFFTTKAEGNGLGLVLSQRTVALHGGKIWAEGGGLHLNSEKKRLTPDADDNGKSAGMTFCVILPLA